MCVRVCAQQPLFLYTPRIDYWIVRRSGTLEFFLKISLFRVECNKSVMFGWVQVWAVLMRWGSWRICSPSMPTTRSFVRWKIWQARCTSNSAWLWYSSSTWSVLRLTKLSRVWCITMHWRNQGGSLCHYTLSESEPTVILSTLDRWHIKR